MNPLTKAVDEFLRESLHSILIREMRVPNPFTKSQKILLNLMSWKVQIFEYTINFKDWISSALNELFYNLNCLNLHDFETYEMLRAMAQEKFNLKLITVFFLFLIF